MIFQVSARKVRGEKMKDSVKVIPIECKFGATSAYVYYIDAKEPAIIDAGIAESPASEIEQALEEHGFDIKDIQWILLTHGHLDHLGGAYALWEKTGKHARVVIPEKEAYLLRNRESHVSDYERLQGQYLDEEVRKKHISIFLNDIGESMEPAMVVKEGDKLSLGNLTISVIETPGHSIGSVTYLVDGLNWAFAADAVQMYGGANSGIPTIEFPAFYRESVRRLYEEIRPHCLYLGHHFLNAKGEVAHAQLEGEEVEVALRNSLDMDAKLKDIAEQYMGDGRKEPVIDSVYGPFKAIAEDLHYKGNPQNLPCSFFVTCNGYQKELQSVSSIDERKANR